MVLSREGFGFRQRFLLQSSPVAERFVVFVDDRWLPATETSGRVNWTLDPSRGAVDFTPLGVPAPGSLIRVEFEARR